MTDTSTDTPTDTAPPPSPTSSTSSTSSSVSAIVDTRWKIFWIIGLLSLVADQATKIWARASLPTHPAGCNVPEDFISHKCGGAPVDVISGFWEWHLSMNPGAAFSMLGGQSFSRVLLSAIGVLAVAGMLWMLKKARADQKVLHYALAFVVGGAVGNLIDRIYHGVVTDFVLWKYKTHHWPVFNIADVVLVVGVGLMVIDIQKEGKREKAAKKAAQEKAKAAGLLDR